MSSYDVAAGLLALAAAIGIINDRWLGLPHTIALLLGALLAASLLMASDTLFAHSYLADRARGRLAGADLPDVLLDGVLPLLLFAGSMHIQARDLRDRAGTVLALATAGVALATVLFGLGFAALTWLAGAPVPLVWCLVLGAILAPTDAVMVEGLLRRVNLPAALRGIIAGKSLFNDGAAVVFFLAALRVAGGDHGAVGNGKLLLAIAAEGVGGAALGWAAGVIVARLSRGLADRTLEVTVSLALALSVFRIAALIGVSGPIAVVAAGLAYRHAPRWARSDQADHSLVTRSWDVIDGILNTFLFLLMGFQLLAVPLGLNALSLMAGSFLIALAARGLSVCIPVLALRLTWRATGRAIAVLTWTGLRGGISIALALTLPATPYRDLLLTVCYGVVVLTIVLQGLLVPRVLRSLYGAQAAATR